MANTIKEASKNYKPKSAKNITELKSVSVDSAMFEESGKDQNDEDYNYNYIEVEGERYRIPDSVLRDLKSILEKKPTLKNFTVSKSGEGRMTRYQVIPLE